MDKPQIIGLGLNGLVGSRVTELLQDKYNFISLGRKDGIDLADPHSPLDVVADYASSGAKYLIHMAAKTDVDACEKDKGWGYGGEAWKINTLSTGWLAGFCEEVGYKMIYISTDFIFNGEKPEGQFYIEEDQPNPINWYAQTKFEGEKLVQENINDYLILRLAYPYRANFDLKPDFMRAIKNRLEQGLEVKAVTDHIFCPTFIDDFAIALDRLIENDASGTYHVVGSESLNPYEAALKIADTFDLDKSLISKTTREEFFKDRAPRPFNLALSNGKIEELGVKMKGFEEGLLVIKSQLQ